MRTGVTVEWRYGVSLVQGSGFALGVRPFFFFNDTATTEIYTLSLHDALPISYTSRLRPAVEAAEWSQVGTGVIPDQQSDRSEEHTSELQSLAYLVCRLLLEKKKNISATRLPSINTTSRLV